jgi:tetraacyldisaccharide 4'-kinase
MRPPEFWRHTEGKEAARLTRALLTPIAHAYAAAGARRIATSAPQKVERPVICVGNVTLGGAGKTPVVRALRAMLAEGGVKAVTLSRGHGGRLKGPVQVDPATHSAADVGDEPLVHASDGPAVIARDRVAGARAAIGLGADAVLMDDGFQNPALHKDLSLLVFDADYGLGNGCIFPAGPLREPLDAGLARAQAIVVMRAAPAPGPRPDYLHGFAGPVLDAWLEPAGLKPEGRLLAFAGIARPEKFFATLERMGAEIVDGAAYPDHHPFNQGELTWLAKLAAAREARLITTEKDAARLPAPWRAQVLTLPVRARLFAPEPLADLLAGAVRRR